MASTSPRHVAIIMDGNGRWAQSRGVPRAKGHEAGADSVRAVVRECRKRGVEALTLYSFSTENWKRPPDEVSALMSLLKTYVLQERSELMGQGIKVRVIGQMSRLPLFVRKPLGVLCKDSSSNSGMVLNLALSYGSRAEIVSVVRQVARDAVDGKLDPDAITEQAVTDRLYTAGLPDPDLLIRTSGELRLSNFLLWQLAYTEIYVTDTYWPDFREPQLEDAFKDFAGRRRRFGRTDAQLKED
jgi:undecaprenyl diphosphate synthase|tara:strand:+ start:271 stop:996 length:726 start_codon:yes stop_codon:yes gene_type:complete